MEWLSFIDVSQKKNCIIYHCSNYQTHEKDETISMDPKMLGNLGVDKTKNI
jgi:hypothetical protein